MLPFGICPRICGETALLLADDWARRATIPAGLFQCDKIPVRKPMVLHSGNTQV